MVACLCTGQIKRLLSSELWWFWQTVEAKNSSLATTFLFHPSTPLTWCVPELLSLSDSDSDSVDAMGKSHRHSTVVIYEQIWSQQAVFSCVCTFWKVGKLKKKISRSEKPFPGDSVSSNWWLLVIIHSLLDVSWLPGEPISAVLASGLADDVSNDVIALHNSPLHIKIRICSVQRIMYVDTVVLKWGEGARRQYSSPWRTGYNSAAWT